MGSKKIVNIKCSGAESLPVDSIEDMQGNLKKRGQKEIESIITSIKKYGFSFPFFIWKHKGTNKCLDGHGRIEALKQMRERGYELPLFPVAYIEASNEKEAKQKLLRVNSQYGAMSIDSVMEFAGGMDVSWDDLSLPGVEFFSRDMEFEPSLNPTINTNGYDESDMIKAEHDLNDKNLRKKPQVVEFVCPECGETFFMEKAILLDMIEASDNEQAK